MLAWAETGWSAFGGPRSAPTREFSVGLIFIQLNKISYGGNRSLKIIGAVYQQAAVTIGDAAFPVAVIHIQVGTGSGDSRAQHKTVI